VIGAGFKGPLCSILPNRIKYYSNRLIAKLQWAYKKPYGKKQTTGKQRK